MTDDLAHHGVKGMKWHKGNKSKHPVAPPVVVHLPPAETAAQKASDHATATKHAAADHNVAMARTNSDLAQIHQQYAAEVKGLSARSPGYQKALAQAKQAHVDNMNKAAHKPKPGMPISKVPPKKYGIVQRGKGWGVHLVKPIKHDAFATEQTGGVSNSDILFTITPIFKDGIPVAVPAVSTVMTHSEFNDDGLDEQEAAILAHHGIKGMKWGVRKAGSEPTGGRAHRKTTKTLSDKHVSPDAKEAAVLSYRAKTSGTNNLSNAELKRLNERLNLEQQYSRMSTTQKNAGRKFAEDTLKNQGQQLLAKAIAKKIAKTAAIAALF